MYSYITFVSVTNVWRLRAKSVTGFRRCRRGEAQRTSTGGGMTMSDLFDDRDDDLDDSKESDGASLVGGGGPASTLNDDAEMHEADFHGDRLAGGDREDRPDGD